MARAEPYTGLALDQWTAILGIDPWSFNGIRYPAPKSAQCEDVLAQFPWQKDHLSRTEIAQAIADAEQMLADELLYWPAPTYFLDEVVQYPRPARRDLYGFAGTPRGEFKSVQLKWHKVISGGVFNRTLIANIPQANIIATDEDGDDVQETFTATLTDPAIGTITDPYELGLYFVAGDRHGEAIGETWRVRPLRISISGNTATFVGHRALLVNPEKEFAVNPQPLNAIDNSIYVTSLDCYRAFTDTTATASTPYQGVAVWKNDPSCIQDCTFQIKELCLGEDDNDNGVVFASFGSPSTWPFPTREPHRLEVNYVAGLPLVAGQMPSIMAQMVTYLSVALLANEKCGCDRSNRILAFYRKRITRFEDASVNATAFEEGSIPFPMTVGGVFAWKRVLRMRNMESLSL